MYKTKAKSKIKNKLWKILTKEMVQKLLSVGVSVSLMLAMVPQTAWGAESEPTDFVTSAYANHWGRSDLRAYLNNLQKSAQSSPMPLDSSSATNSANYPSQFTDDEFDLVEPFTYSTNVLDVTNSKPNATATYETTDRFWLPSGNHSNPRILSWGREDISSSSQYSSTTALALSRVIPLSYWASGPSLSSWLRSPDCSSSDRALRADRGDGVFGNDVNDTNAVAGAFKIDLSSVVFASAASAASIADGSGSAASTISIDRSLNFGKEVSDDLPTYGMYLKTRFSANFEAKDVSLSSKLLTVNYTGGAANQYVMVQAYASDSFEKGSSTYVAAGKLSGQDSSVTINVTDWNLSTGEASDLDGYQIQVWMEDANNGSSLAPATMPQTFKYSPGEASFSKDTNYAKSSNPRVFALKNELQCSWGTLKKADDLYDEETWTNQKIYFGSENGQKTKPLEFWIAGREDAVNGGEIDADGQFMTLYQAKSVETTEFNTSVSNYTGSDDAITLQLADKQSANYTGSTVKYPEPDTNIKFSGQDGLQKDNLHWQYREKITDVWSEGMPKATGTYEIRCYAPGTDNYERTYSAPVSFTVKLMSFPVKLIPTAADFEFTKPSNLTYDGSSKIATVTPKSGISGMGNVTVNYYDEAGIKLSSAPTNVGTYTVKIDVAAGALYTSASNLTDSTWVFNIAKAMPTVPHGLTAIYGQTLSEISLPEGWTWNSPSDLVGDVGDQRHYATFTPADPDNYNSITKGLSVTVKPDTSTWGTESEIAGIPHWIDATGTTSVEVAENGMIWLKEESGGSSAWYGIDNSDAVFEIGSRFWVRWLNRDSYPVEFANLWEQLDDIHKNSIDDDNAWLFEIGVTSPDGTAYSNLSQQVSVYVQIGDDWDKEDLQGYYVSAAQDEQVHTTFVDNHNYPEGQDTFGIMNLSHFSPYFIYDKLTDEEKAELDKLMENLSDEQKQQLEQQAASALEQAKTGDEVTYFTISGLGLIMTLALGLMIKSKLNKRKFE